MAQNLMALYQEAIGSSRDRAAGVGGAIDRFKDFDATAGFETAVRGASDRARRGFDDSIRDLKGSSVRTGRLNTGFFDEDAGDVFERTSANLDNTISQYALQSQGQQLQANQSYLSAEQGQQQQYYDLLSGGMDREQAEKNAREQRRSSLLTGLVGLAGTGLGLAFGGPAGAAAGGTVAKSLTRGMSS